MNSSLRQSSNPDSRLQPLYPFRPLSEDTAELLRVEAPASNTAAATEKAWTLYPYRTGGGRALRRIESAPVRRR